MVCRWVFAADERRQRDHASGSAGEIRSGKSDISAGAPACNARAEGVVVRRRYMRAILRAFSKSANNWQGVERPLGCALGSINRVILTYLSEASSEEVLWSQEDGWMAERGCSLQPRAPLQFLRRQSCMGSRISRQFSMPMHSCHAQASKPCCSRSDASVRNPFTVYSWLSRFGSVEADTCRRR